MARRTRFEAYMLLAVVAGVAGFYLGERHADPPGCDDVGECSLGTEVGLATAGFALVIVLLFVGGAEVAVRFVRQHQRAG